MGEVTYAMGDRSCLLTIAPRRLRHIQDETTGQRRVRRRPSAPWARVPTGGKTKLTQDAWRGERFFTGVWIPRCRGSTGGREVGGAALCCDDV